MRISRVVIKNYRAIQFFDIPIDANTTVVIGENNAGKTSLVHALRLCLDVTLSSGFRLLGRDDIYCAVDQSAPFPRLHMPQPLAR
jgi:putative ATP-dependent endonuclease of OLD family